MRFHKKEGKGIGFGELIPILYPDQQITIDTFKKVEKEFREGKRKRRLTEEEQLNIYKLDERQRFKFEKEKANKFYTGMGLAFIVLIITTIPVYIYIPNYSFLIINILFVIDIFFNIYLYSKQYNKYDKLRERDLYLAILDIKKEVNDLIENINKKTKT